MVTTRFNDEWNAVHLAPSSVLPRGSHVKTVTKIADKNVLGRQALPSYLKWYKHEWHPIFNGDTLSVLLFLAFHWVPLGLKIDLQKVNPKNEHLTWTQARKSYIVAGVKMRQHNLTNIYFFWDRSDVPSGAVLTLAGFGFHTVVHSSPQPGTGRHIQCLCRYIWGKHYH